MGVQEGAGFAGEPIFACLGGVRGWTGKALRRVRARHGRHGGGHVAAVVAEVQTGDSGRNRRGRRGESEEEAHPGFLAKEVAWGFDRDDGAEWKKQQRGRQRAQ